MNLRARFAFWFAVFVAIILSVACTIIYMESADFRQEEFFKRLEQKAQTTHRFWFDVQEIDSTLLKIIDRNDMTTLYQEQVLMFGPDNRLIYSSIDNDSVHFDQHFLTRVKKEKRVYYSDDMTQIEHVGLVMKREGQDFVLLASAYDLYGFRKLSNLFKILIFTWMTGLGLTILLAYLYVRNIVGQPLADLISQIAGIGEKDLTKRIKVPGNQNELTILAQDFNSLLERLEKAFNAQRSFVQYASHELRTPLANMLSETEHALSMERDAAFYQKTLLSLREEQSRLVEMTNALLLLSRYQHVIVDQNQPVLRIDEVLYQTMEEVKTSNPDYRISLGFVDFPANENALMVRGIEPLLRTAFRNLLENACRYGQDHQAQLQITYTEPTLEIWFDNTGATLSEQEQLLLFTPFFRGENATGKRGFGLGIVIAQRILALHGAILGYQIPRAGTNRFVAKFTQNPF